MIDYDKFTVAQLKELYAKLPAVISKRVNSEKQAVLAKLRADLSAQGFTLDDLMASKSSAGKSRGAVAPKYRHPENATLQWTGRGRTPAWIAAWCDGGGKIDDLLIQ